MARAPKLESIDEREMRLSRDYLKGALEPALKAKLAVHDNGVWLVNPATGSTYGVYTLPPADPATGMVRVTLARDGTPAFGLPGANWLALHDPRTNRACVIAFPDLGQWMRAVMQAPQPGWLMAVRVGADAFHVLIHLDWAKGANLVRLDVPLKKGDYQRWRDLKLATAERFVHLHNHSMYSLLDGVSTIEGIADAALLNGQPGIALTDHGNVYGTYKHWVACRERGLHAMMGVEAYVVDDLSRKYVTEDGQARRWEYHQTLIAMNDEGWANLGYLMTVAGRDHHHYVPRIDHKLLFEHNAGIICLSGCFKGMAAHYLQHRQPREGEAKLPWWLEYNPDRARQTVRAYKAAFGDRYYGEVMNIDFEQYNRCLPELLQLLDDEGVPKLITNDCHYVRPEDAILQAVLSRISTQKVDSLGDQMRDRGVYYIRSKEEMQVGASWATEDMFERTCEVMERCTLTFDHKGYLFPQYPPDDDWEWVEFVAAGRSSKGMDVPKPTLVPQASPDCTEFDGQTYEPELDETRLEGQMRAVYAVMKDGAWRTPEEILGVVGQGTTAGITARLRDFRKPKFGGLCVESRRRGAGGSWEYQLRASVKAPEPRPISLP